MNGKINNKQHPKYPYQRAEQRYNNIDTAGLKEQHEMETQTHKLTIGTFNILPPKPDTKISSFILALPTAMPKHQLYQKLFETFNGHWDGEPIKSLCIHLSTPIPLQELRKILKENFADSQTT